jgi:hypothetical protein
MSQVSSQVTIKDELQSNSIKDELQSNSIKDELQSNSIKDELQSNSIKDELQSNSIKDVTQITQDFGGMVRFPSTSGISLNAVWIVYFKDNQVYFLTLLHPASSFSGPFQEDLKERLPEYGFQRHENNLYIKPQVIVNAQIVPEGIQYQENGRAQRIIEV